MRSRGDAGVARGHLRDMDPLTRLLIRLAQWFRHPPPRSRIVLTLAAAALAIGIVLIERYVGWPDWAQTERVPIRRM